jgi:hypothetical protein
VSDTQRIRGNPKRIELENLLDQIKESAERYRLEHGNYEFVKLLTRPGGRKLVINRKAYD